MASLFCSLSQFWRTKSLALVESKMKIRPFVLDPEFKEPWWKSEKGMLMRIKYDWVLKDIGNIQYLAMHVLGCSNTYNLPDAINMSNWSVGILKNLFLHAWTIHTYRSYWCGVFMNFTWYTTWILRTVISCGTWEWSIGALSKYLYETCSHNSHNCHNERLSNLKRNCYA